MLTNIQKIQLVGRISINALIIVNFSIWVNIKTPHVKTTALSPLKND